jgi:hypothetical protein
MNIGDLRYHANRLPKIFPNLDLMRESLQLKNDIFIKNKHKKYIVNYLKILQPEHFSNNVLGRTCYFDIPH